MKKMLLECVCLMALVLAVSSCHAVRPAVAAPEETADSVVVLQKAADKDFVILNISDPQLTSAEWQAGAPARTVLLKTMEELVARVKPDLITISGDLSYGDQHQAYECLASYLDSFCIPWAPAWGNHDNQTGLDNIRKIAEKFQKHQFCVLRDGPEELGNGNYVIEIREQDIPVSAVFIMNTHDREAYPTPDDPDNKCWSKLYPEQLAWYKSMAKELKTAGFKDSAIVTHIPIYAYRLAFQAAYDNAVPAEQLNYQQTLNGACWNPGYEDSFGYKHEEIASFPEDEGALDALKEADFTSYIICGHDHVNNTVIKYQGITMIYSLKAGAGCYWEYQCNGGTVLTIGHDGIKGVHHEFVDMSEYKDKF